MRPFRVQAPFGDVVALDDLRDHCRQIGAEHDAKITAAAAAAVDYLDGYSGRLGRCILEQKWAFPLTSTGQTVRLPFPDSRDFKLEYRDGAGDWQVVPDITFGTAHDYVWVETNNVDQEGPLFITAVAGAESASDIPDRIKQIVRALTVLWFDTPSTVTIDARAQEMPHGIETMIRSLRNVA